MKLHDYQTIDWLAECYETYFRTENTAMCNELLGILAGYGLPIQRTDDDDGRWITTKKTGKPVHINENGVPDKGNPHIIAAMKGESDRGNSSQTQKGVDVPAESGAMVSEAPTSGSAATAKAHWPDDFPKVTVHTNLKTLRDPELHPRAKHGDMAAADELVDRCVKPERVEELARKYPDAKVVPVRSEDSEGTNRIPLAYARRFEDYGLEVDSEIVQTKKAGHTDSDQFHRLMSRPGFDGAVRKGQQYILVDDHITNGGTMNDLRKYIEARGGRVVAVSTLSASQGGTFIAIQQKTIDRLYQKHGKGINDLLRKAGIAHDVESLTDKEGRYILSMAPETLRRKIEMSKNNYDDEYGHVIYGETMTREEIEAVRKKQRELLEEAREVARRRKERQKNKEKNNG